MFERRGQQARGAAAPSDRGPPTWKCGRASARASAHVYEPGPRENAPLPSQPIQPPKQTQGRTKDRPTVRHACPEKRSRGYRGPKPRGSLSPLVPRLSLEDRRFTPGISHRSWRTPTLRSKNSEEAGAPWHLPNTPAPSNGGQKDAGHVAERDESRVNPSAIVMGGPVGPEAQRPLFELVRAYSWGFRTPSDPRASPRGTVRDALSHISHGSTP